MAIIGLKDFQRAVINAVLFTTILFIAACSEKQSEQVETVADDVQQQSKSVNAAQQMPRVEPDGTIHVPAFDIPESAYLSDETRAELKHWREVGRKDLMARTENCPPFEGATMADMPAIRQCQAQAFYKTSFYKHLRSRFNVTMTPKTIGGIYTEVFIPDGGVASKNKNRVLINVHGGGYRNGSRMDSHMESVPIASVGNINVISIDYRMAPEYRFPAASEDVAAVYRELLKEYKPENIGIYGCSAGAMLVAHSIAWFLNEGLPLPGAAGMFCAGALTALDNENFKLRYGDGLNINGAILGIKQRLENQTPPVRYFDGIKHDTPLTAPGGYDEVMKQFPPSLLISGTRDFDLSEVIQTHRQLTRLGVEADLHMWEGMGHGFFVLIPGLPESREAYNVIVKFFDEHLGRQL